jgi:hypothetical protein
MTIEDNSVVAYRAKVNVSFKVREDVERASPVREYQQMIAEAALLVMRAAS